MVETHTARVCIDRDRCCWNLYQPAVVVMEWVVFLQVFKQHTPVMHTDCQLTLSGLDKQYFTALHVVTI